MKTCILTLCLSFASISFACGQFEGPVWEAKSAALRDYIRGEEVLRGIYRSRIADLIEEATKVEVYLLDFSMGDIKREKPPAETFRIAPYSKETAILSSHTCTDEERRELVLKLSVALRGVPSNGGVLCHYPIHGLRVWVNDDIAFETSICWTCANFQMEYANRPAWENLTAGFIDLQPLLTRLMPIPQDEMDRFKKAKKGE